MKLGVVVPCYRQEACLARTLPAIEAALAGRDWERVLVLSAPGATAPAVARGWTTIAPPVQRPLTPGGARMLGFAACAGTHVLFVDADVEIDPVWLSAALARAEADERLGGVWGRIEEWFVADGREWQGSDDLLRVGRTERAVQFLTAVALYRRDALLAAGGYDARLRSEEDFELGLRLGRLAVQLRSLGMRAGRHWSAPRPNFAELARRWRAGLCFGQGQVLRLYLGRPGFFRLLQRQSLYVATLIGWALGIAAALAIPVAGIGWFTAWAGALLLLLAAMSVRKRSPRLGVLALLTWTLNGAGMVVGLARGLDEDAAAYAGRPA
jgi:Glycosyl transferase family 2